MQSIVISNAITNIRSYRTTYSILTSTYIFTECCAANVPLNVAKELIGPRDVFVSSKIRTQVVDEVFKQKRERLEESANKKIPIKRAEQDKYN